MAFRDALLKIRYSIFFRFGFFFFFEIIFLFLAFIIESKYWLAFLALFVFYFWLYGFVIATVDITNWFAKKDRSRQKTEKLFYFISYFMVIGFFTFVLVFIMNQVVRELFR